MGRAGKVLAVLIVIAIVGAAGYVLFTYGPSLIKSPPPQNNVLVEGFIRTGFGASPRNITFISQSTGRASSTTINKNGYYSIALLGGDTYTVTAYYNTLFGVSTNSNCSGTLTLNNTANTINFSRSC